MDPHGNVTITCPKIERLFCEEPTTTTTSTTPSTSMSRSTPTSTPATTNTTATASTFSSNAYVTSLGPSATTTTSTASSDPPVWDAIKAEMKQPRTFIPIAIGAVVIVIGVTVVVARACSRTRVNAGLTLYKWL